jgi:serine/threonine protein kinase
VADSAGQIDDPDEETSIDPAVDPDEEPTSLRPSHPVSIDSSGMRAHNRHHQLGRVPPPGPPISPAEPAPSPRLARGSSHGAGIGLNGRIGKYELRDKLGRGAFGVVFTARDPSLDRDVAVKVLRPTHLTNQDIVQRFLQEARATARISHPGIVTIHDCGQVETNLGATAFIAMELLIGESLTSRLTRSGRLAPETAIEIARQIASALEAAHRADVLHRDLKPDNIYLVPDPVMQSGERVKVLDFGLAKLGQEGHTQLQTVFGTPRYMSPEQCRSATQVDHRSDIYALGCILFELVTGRWPFDGDVRQLIECHQGQIPPRAASLVPELSPALDDLIADMLAKDPMDRPQTMGAVQRALHRASGVHAPVAELVATPAVLPALAPPTGHPRARRSIPRPWPLPPLFAEPEHPVARPRSEPRAWSEAPELTLPGPRDAPMLTDPEALSGEILVPASAAGSPRVEVQPVAEPSGWRAKRSGMTAMAVLLLIGLGTVALLTVV